MNKNESNFLNLKSRVFAEFFAPTVAGTASERMLGENNLITVLIFLSATSAVPAIAANNAPALVHQMTNGRVAAFDIQMHPMPHVRVARVPAAVDAVAPSGCGNVCKAAIFVSAGLVGVGLAGGFTRNEHRS